VNAKHHKRSGAGVGVFRKCCEAPTASHRGGKHRQVREQHQQLVARDPHGQRDEQNMGQARRPVISGNMHPIADPALRGFEIVQVVPTGKAGGGPNEGRKGKDANDRKQGVSPF
jgi:hypothetical protein